MGSVRDAEAREGWASEARGDARARHTTSTCERANVSGGRDVTRRRDRRRAPNRGGEGGVEGMRAKSAPGNATRPGLW